MNKYLLDHKYWLRQIVFKNDQEALKLLWEKCHIKAVEKCMNNKKSVNGVRRFNKYFSLQQLHYEEAIHKTILDLLKKHQDWLLFEPLDLIAVCISFAGNKACDVMKTKEYKNNSFMYYTDIIPDKKGYNTSKKALNEELHEAINLILASKPRWATIMGMHLDGYELEEIAQTLGMTVRSVSATRSRIINEYFKSQKSLFTNF